jgi:hypothetical protein
MPEMAMQFSAQNPGLLERAPFMPRMIALHVRQSHAHYSQFMTAAQRIFSIQSKKLS